MRRRLFCKHCVYFYTFRRGCSCPLLHWHELKGNAKLFLISPVTSQSRATHVNHGGTMAIDRTLTWTVGFLYSRELECAFVWPLRNGDTNNRLPEITIISQTSQTVFPYTHTHTLPAPRGAAEPSVEEWTLTLKCLLSLDSIYSLSLYPSLLLSVALFWSCDILCLSSVVSATV